MGAGGGGDTGGGVACAAESCCPSRLFAPPVMPWAIVEAPKMMKQPMTTCAARRISMRPDSIRNPTEATAITATVVAIGPSRVPWTQPRAETIGLAGETVKSTGVT